MTPPKLVRKDRILEYLDNMIRQLEDIQSIPVPDREFFLQRDKIIEIKAIKYSLACAIQDISRISAHIASALSLWKLRESESEAILALSDAGILPKEFGERSSACQPSGTGSSTIIYRMNLMQKSSSIAPKILTTLRTSQSISSNGLTASPTNDLFF